ncbi:MAG: hypothetical protein ACRC61_19465, partial [Aeromonas salmonicida]
MVQKVEDLRAELGMLGEPDQMHWSSVHSESMSESGPSEPVTRIRMQRIKCRVEELREYVDTIWHVALT